jgi:hypothetical protein
MNPMNIAAQQCQVDTFMSIQRSLYSSGYFQPDSQFDGLTDLNNAFVRRNTLDALAQAGSCSSDDITRMLSVLSRSDNLRAYGSISKGPQFELVKNIAESSSGYVLTEVKTMDLIPGEYPALAFMSAAYLKQFAFAADTDKKVEGRYFRFLKTSSEGGGRARARNVTPLSKISLAADAQYLVFFTGIASYFQINIDNVEQTDGCMTLTGEGKLVMPDFDPKSWDATQMKVCAEKMTFKFNPAKSEAELPIAKYVNNKFVFKSFTEGGR